MGKAVFLNRVVPLEKLEATTGFEPVNRGFADPRLKPLGYVAPRNRRKVFLPVGLYSVRGKNKPNQPLVSPDTYYNATVALKQA